MKERDGQSEEEHPQGRETAGSPVPTSPSPLWVGGSVIDPREDKITKEVKKGKR